MIHLKRLHYGTRKLSRDASSEAGPEEAAA